MSEARRRVREIAREHLRRGDAVGWFDAVYEQAAGDPSGVPWADLVPNPELVHWLDREATRGDGKRALVIGCGLGDDAMALADRGFAVDAFDVSPHAIAWAPRRWPTRSNAVHWHVADLFALPAAFRRAFDFVFEAYTIQSFRDDATRERAMRCIAETLAPEGTLVVVARGRDAGDHVEGPPWPLSPEELSHFVDVGLREVSVEDFFDAETPPQRRLRAVYRRIDD